MKRNPLAAIVVLSAVLLPWSLAQAAEDAPASDEVADLRQQLAKQIEQCNTLASSTRRTIESSDHELAAQRQRYADLAERYNQLRSENSELGQRLKSTSGALDYNYQQSLVYKQGQEKVAGELGAVRQTSVQLQAKLEALQQELQAAHQKNLEQAMALASERQHAKDAQEQLAQLQQRVTALSEVNSRQAESLAKAALPSVGIGERLRLPAATLFTSETDGKPSSQMLPEGSTVTVVGTPRGTTGFYAVTTEQGSTGWISLR